MPSRLAGFVCPTVSMVTTGHATGVEKTLLAVSCSTERLNSLCKGMSLHIVYQL